MLQSSLFPSSCFHNAHCPHLVWANADLFANSMMLCHFAHGASSQHYKYDRLNVSVLEVAYVRCLQGFRPKEPEEALLGPLRVLKRNCIDENKNSSSKPLRCLLRYYS
ncbi:unnamed protein product [Ixodes pacificus]